MRNHLAGLAVFVLGASLGCGDNSRDCGPGTVEDNGFCVPAATCGFGTRADEETGQCVPDGNLVCSDGTVFDPLTGSCKIDEAACQNGTVLIEDACVDPTSGLTIDVQEGPEPNGLGVIEASDAQAGNIVIKPTGETFVIHGTLDPHRDLDNDGLMDPDADTFVLQTGSPLFLKITADGVNGTAAGFVAIAAVDAGDPLAGWERVGMSLVSDTAVREVFLPRAGTYRIAVADTRTLVEYVMTGSATAAPGGDTSEYYVSLTSFDPPAPTPLTLTGGRVSTTRTKPSEQLALFTAPLGTGLNQIQLAMPSNIVDAAVVVLTNDMFRTTAAEAGGPARVMVGNVAAGDTTVIIVDHVYTLLPTAVTYTLDVIASNATALSTTGGTVMATATTSSGSDFTRLNLFSFDVSAADASVGMLLTFSPSIVGQIYDGVGERAATFTSPATATQWSTFRGLVRFPAAGRYYFAVYAPSATSMTTLNVTSTIVELAPTPIENGTPLTAPISSLRVSPFTYAAGTTDAWQQFNVAGVNTGGQFVSWLDPSTAYGRLDSLSTSAGVLQSEVMPIFSQSFATSGGAIGRVLLADPTLQYYVKVNALSPTTNPTATLTFEKRAAMTDLGNLASGNTAVRTGETIDSATPQRFYLFRTPVGKTATITVTPTSNVNTQFRRLRNDETALGALINANNAPDVEAFVQTGTDWTAFVVSSAGPLASARTFDVRVQIQ